MALLPPSKELCCPAGIDEEIVKKDCIGAISGETIEDSVLLGCPVLINRRRKLLGKPQVTNEDFHDYSDTLNATWKLEVELMVEDTENYLNHKEGQGE